MMDKQEATAHILTRLQAGHQPEEIAEELSRLVNVPSEKVRPFVDQVATSHLTAIPQPQVDSGGALPETEPATGFSDLPPGLRALLREAETAGLRAQNTRAAEPAPNFQAEKTPEMPLPRQAEFVAPSDKAEASDIDLEALSEAVLHQLKKQRRHNDIVESICKETGWHWNKSQRFVARLQTKHHDELQSGKNRVTMLVGIGIILAGLVLAINGIDTISDYAKLAAFAKTNPEVLLEVEPPIIFFALSATVTGLGMIVGGGYGVARSVTNQ